MIECPENFLKLVADDIEQLRRCDVFRLLSTAADIDAASMRVMAKYVVQHRDDLIDEVCDVIAELETEAGVECN